MENQGQELDAQGQENQNNPNPQQQETNPAGDYNNDAGVIPDGELKGSDADKDSGNYPGKATLPLESNDVDAAKMEAGEKNLDEDIDKGINESTD